MLNRKIVGGGRFCDESKYSDLAIVCRTCGSIDVQESLQDFVLPSGEIIDVWLCGCPECQTLVSDPDVTKIGAVPRVVDYDTGLNVS